MDRRLPLGSIGRANLDGTGVDQSFITGFERQVTASPSTPTTSTGRRTSYRPPSPDPTSPDAIGRANLDGTGVERSFIPVPGVGSAARRRGRRRPYLLAQPAASASRRSPAPTSTAPGSMNASSTLRLRTTAVGLAVDAEHVYWADWVRRLSSPRPSAAPTSTAQTSTRASSPSPDLQRASRSTASPTPSSRARPAPQDPEANAARRSSSGSSSRPRRG